jgi:hypothetical protein
MSGWTATLQDEELAVDVKTLKALVGYRIAVTATSGGGGAWEIVRRYNHFADLDAAIRAAGVVPPPMPPRQLREIALSMGAVAKERSPVLRAYLEVVARSPAYASLPVVQEWLSPAFAAGLVSLARPDRAGFLECADSWAAAAFLSSRRFYVLVGPLLAWWSGFTAYTPKKLDPPKGVLSLVDRLVTRTSACRIEIRPVLNSEAELVLSSTSTSDIDDWAQALTKAATAASSSSSTQRTTATAQTNCCEPPVGGRSPI